MTRRHHLQTLLNAHDPADATESAHLDAMQALLQRPGDVFSRDHYDPGHFTASAFVLSPDRRDLLMIFHGKLHRWLQPGGHIDPEDSDVEHASRREVMEETGATDLDLWQPGILDVDVHAIPSLKGAPAHRHFDVRFAFVAPSRDIVAGDDAEAATWVPLTRVPEMETDASVLRAVARLTR